MLGIGCIIGAGLFSITGIAAAEHAGPAITIAFVIASIACALAVSVTGSSPPMIPIAEALTPTPLPPWESWRPGSSARDLILEYAIGASTVSISWSAYLVSLLQEFGIQVPSAILASPWQPVSLPMRPSKWPHQPPGAWDCRADLIRFDRGHQKNRFSSIP